MAKWHPRFVPENKSEDEIERLRTIVTPIRDDLERTSRVQKALARLRARKTKEGKLGNEKEQSGTD
jgi:hypothetical protein